MVYHHPYKNIYVYHTDTFHIYSKIHTYNHLLDISIIMLKNISKPNDNSNNDSVSVRLVKAFANTAPLLPIVVSSFI